VIPVIFSIPLLNGITLPINSFGLMVALAFIGGTTLLGRSLARDFEYLNIKDLKLTPEIVAEKVVMVAAISGILGARLWYLVTDYFYNPCYRLGTCSVIENLFAPAGFIFFGGFIFAGVSLAIYLRFLRINILKFADCTGPTLALGYAIGRLGCQLSGDGDYGRATTTIFGMSYASGVIPTSPGVLALPTPLYESILAILIAIFLVKIEKNLWFRSIGSRFAIYLILISLERFFIEFFRIELRVVRDVLSQAQLFSIGIIFFALFLLLYRRPLKRLSS
jgi:phosphatidylglycerol:prolipoprotein diacylglycerol transferase